ncbi:MAG: MerR family transcriptional regulator [Acidobacteria bacterium]|nr:MerR family transcriptional regulator [Acidobacteriota bacterium]
MARLTGLTVDTLRAWERRYQAVRPTRDGRGRTYSEADIARLKALGDLVRRGHAIGSVAGLDDERLRRLLERSRAASGAGQAPQVTLANLGTITTALDAYDLDEVERALNTFAVLLPPRDLVFRVVLPLLREVGDRWERGTLRPSQEHLISAIVRSVLGGLLRAATRPNGQTRPHAVFATPAGERHELGLLSAAVLAASAGISLVYLGADLPASDIGHAAATTDARVVVLALTTSGGLAPAERRALADLARERAVWAGGAAAAGSLARPGNGRIRTIPDLESFVAALQDHVR